MNRIVAVWWFILLALVVSCERPEPRTLVYYYEIICPACPESREMERVLGIVVQLGRDFDHVHATAHDIHRRDGFDTLRQTLSRLDRDPATISFPLLIVDDEIFVGFVEIEAELSRLANRR
jgi:hypothetical protein